jgi:hypothetical protein
LGKLEKVKIKRFRIGTLSRTSYDANTLRFIDLACSVSDMFRTYGTKSGEQRSMPFVEESDRKYDRHKTDVIVMKG